MNTWNVIRLSSNACFLSMLEIIYCKALKQGLLSFYRHGTLKSVKNNRIEVLRDSENGYLEYTTHLYVGESQMIRIFFNFRKK